jgi:hypothetical protein
MVWDFNGNHPSESSHDRKTISGITPPCPLIFTPSLSTRDFSPHLLQDEKALMFRWRIQFAVCGEWYRQVQNGQKISDRFTLSSAKCQSRLTTNQV